MTGRLKVINGYWYVIINYKDSLNQYKKKQINTNLKERGNKKKAEEFKEEQLKLFEKQLFEGNKEPPMVDNNIIFIDYVEKYIEDKKSELSPAVYKSYSWCLKIIKEYFGNKLKLKDVTYHHLEDFYEYLKNERNNKNVTVKHYAVILSPALRQAYRDDLIAKNPYEFMPKIKKEKPPKNYYNKEELEELFSHTDKTPIALVVRVAAYYGFRRSELLGLRWQSIDFLKKTITIDHKILNIDKIMYQSDFLKTTASYRTLPLLPSIEKLLKARQKEIEENKKLYGMSYNHKYDEYVFVNDCGDMILPDYVSHTFSKLLKRHKLKHIRFHDLRHSCASLLLASKVPMKNIQEWLGHANYNTTADVYSHLDFSSKILSANIIDQELSSWQEKTEAQHQLEEEIEKLKVMIAEKELQLKMQKEKAEME